MSANSAVMHMRTLLCLRYFTRALPIFRSKTTPATCKVHIFAESKRIISGLATQYHAQPLHRLNDMDDAKDHDRAGDPAGKDPFNEQDGVREDRKGGVEHELKAKWAPQIFPPPEGTHLPEGTDPGCSMCEESYYSVRLQELSIGFSSPDNRKWPIYEGPCSDEAAQQAINKINDMILEDLAHVKDNLKSHGDLILKRWTKKSKDKRGTLLSSAARVCFGTWSPQNRKLGLTEEESDIFGPISFSVLFGTGGGGASINIEEFAEDKIKLLSLLHVRSSHAPRDWAMFDSREMHRYF